MIAKKYSELIVKYPYLRQHQGDALIAATACVKNMALVTTNPRHFQPIVELTVMIFPDDFKEATNV